MFRPRTLAASSAVLAGLALAGNASAADTVSLKFDQPGEHEFVVPDGVGELRVQAIGERGGDGARNMGTRPYGGYGGDVSGTVPVTPQRPYWVEIDVGGGKGGAAGGYPGGDGGGASVFRVCRRTDAACEGDPRVIVAGGGGGAAGGLPTTSGAGGNAGAPGAPGDHQGPDAWWSLGGNPGTDAQGGAGGSGFAGRGLPGALELGGDGGSDGHNQGLGRVFAGGGGGGGGYYGGGGGGSSADVLAISGGGGGGGANHYSPSVQSPHVDTAAVAEPSVTLTWFDDVAPAPSITPPDGAVGTHPILHGWAGTALGDNGEVSIDISTPGGSTRQKLYVPRDAEGEWSAQLDELEPGTYVALVAQSDWASNAGRSSVTFRVEAESAASTPTPTPTPAAPHAEPPVIPAAAPTEPKPAIRIETQQARVIHGTLSLRVKCAGPAGGSCRGRLMLTAKHGKRTVALASVPYRVATGRTSTVRAHPRRPLPRRVTITAGKATRTITVR